jgi:tetratricopeptide (TPR) repeat protein
MSLDGVNQRLQSNDAMYTSITKITVGFTILMIFGVGPGLAQFKCVRGRSPAFGQTSPVQRTDAPSQGSATDRTEGRSILARAREQAEKVPEEFHRLYLLDQIGATEARQGDFDAAVDIENRVTRHVTITKNAAAKALGRGLGNADAWEWIQSVLSKLSGPDDLVFMALAQRLKERGKIAEALNICNRIQDGYYRANALSGVARKQAENGDDVGARSTWKMVDHVTGNRYNTDDVNSGISVAQILRGDIAAARATVDSIRSKQTRASALVAGAGIFWDKSDRTNAALWLDEGLKLQDSGSKIWSPLWGLGVSLSLHELAIPLQVKLGQKDAVMRYIDGLGSRQRLHDLDVAALACVEIKDTACIDAAIEKIRSLADKGDLDRRFDASIGLKSVASALADNGEFDSALRLLDELKQEPWPDPVPSSHLITAVILARQGKFAEARNRALQVPRDAVGSPRGDALRRIALLQMKRNGPAACPPWVSALTESKDRGFALLGIAQALLGENEQKLPRLLPGGWTMSLPNAEETN